jgi:hypothetical protein
MAFTFKWYANRGEVVNWKETPQDAVNLRAWWKRIQEIYPTGAPLQASKLPELAKKYGADYLLTQVSAPMLPLPVEYKNESFVVYRMDKIITSKL